MPNGSGIRTMWLVVAPATRYSVAGENVSVYFRAPPLSRSVVESLAWHRVKSGGIETSPSPLGAVFVPERRWKLRSLSRLLSFFRDVCGIRCLVVSQHLAACINAEKIKNVSFFELVILNLPETDFSPSSSVWFCSDY